MTETTKCRLCGSLSKGLCNDCRKWKEFRYKSNICACDVCYVVESTYGVVP